MSELQFSFLEKFSIEKFEENSLSDEELNVEINNNTVEEKQEPWLVIGFRVIREAWLTCSACFACTLVTEPN